MIGFANELPGITPETMRTLIAGARQKGRSWEEIGRRLDMTAEEAKRAYQRLSETYWSVFDRFGLVYGDARGQSGEFPGPARST